MTEQIFVSPSISKAEKYRELLPQIESLITGEEDLIANLANISAALKMAFSFFWVGFYIMRQGELVLGPFQGPLACTRIPLHKGVCGAAARQKKTLVVKDVNQFPGHITCSSESKSEIVVPLVASNEVKLVLDVDSEHLDEFDEVDQEYLEKVVALLKKTLLPMNLS